LPVEVKAEEVDATLKNGVLTVRLPKAQKSKSVSVKVSTD
jgi:HSP20 family molecular chaperone IbpA